MTIVLLTRPDAVLQYVDKIQRAADAEREALGFLPAAAYAEFAYQSRIVVAADQKSGSLLGYALFGGALPQGRIFQIWVDDASRGQNVGRRLVAEVVRQLEQAQFLSVRADVARDLVAANQFYGNLGFEVVRTRPGGKSRGRTIIVRVRELATPSLLDMAADEVGFGSLAISSSMSRRPALYVLDINVLLDVAKQRVRADAAGQVMAAAFENEIRLAVSEEAIAELGRSAVAGSADPVLAFAMTLPRLPMPPRHAIDACIRDLSFALFPGRTQNGKLRARDRSDLLHLSTAINECAAGFITSDNVILAGAEHLRKRYGLDVLSPETFAPPDNPVDMSVVRTVVAGAPISARLMEDADYPAAEALLARLHATSAETRAALSAGTTAHPRRRVLVENDGLVCAIGCWDAPVLGTAERSLTVYLDEAVPFALSCAEHLIGRAIADVGSIGPATFSMTAHVRQPSVRQAAIGRGFFAGGGQSPRSQRLRKIALGSVITPSSWTNVRQRLIERTGLRLPAEPSVFSTLSQTLAVVDEKGQGASLTLQDVERLLSPTLIVLDGRPGVVLPITQSYAEQLFRGSAQPTLLNDREAALHAVRAYISRAGSHSVIREASIAVFYESGRRGGRSAATAVARITRHYLMDKVAASDLALEKGVLEPRTVQAIGSGSQVTVSEFDNLLLLRKPVSLSALREIGCTDGANFVTARSLDTRHLLAILEAGQPYV